MSTLAGFVALIFGATFLVVGAAALLAWIFLERDQSASEESPDILKRERLSALSTLSLLLSRAAFAQPLKRLLSEANLDWTVGRTFLTMLLISGGVFAVLLRLDFVPFWGTVAISLACSILPLLWIRSQRAKRLRAVEAQLPEALDFISRALVAGHSLPMALELLAEEIGAPLAGELRKTVDEYNVGASMEQALENLSERVPSVDIRFFASAIMTQSRTGGSLHELLEGLADTIRERGTLRGQVRALTANGRMTAIVLSALPLLLAIIMYVVNTEYFLLLIHHPIGKMLLMAAICAQVIAYFVIQRIVDIKV